MANPPSIEQMSEILGNQVLVGRACLTIAQGIWKPGDETWGRTGSLLNRADPTPYSEVNFLSGSCEKIERCIREGTIADVRDGLDCRRE